MSYANPTAQTPLITGAGGLVRQFCLSTVGSTSFVSAPAAGATVTWMRMPQDGEYSVQLQYFSRPLDFSTTPRLNNIRLQVDGTVVSSLIMLSSNTMYAATVVLKVLSTNWVALNVITGDGNHQYHGSLLATRMS